MTTHREELAAALAEAQAQLKAGTPGEWQSEHVTGGTFDLINGSVIITQGGPLEDGGEYFGALDQVDADLIVAMHEREQRAIDHGLACLRMIDTLRANDELVCDVIADDLEASLHGLWCGGPR